MSVEVLNLEETSPHIKGHVTVQLFDVVTGELVQEEKGHNFLTKAFTYYMAKLQKTMLSMGAYNNITNVFSVGSEAAGGGTYGLLKNLILSDSVMAESPSTEVKVPGNQIGFATRVPYVGSSTTQGTINQNESWASDYQMHWVFDFATDKANGTIGSVCWKIDNAEYAIRSVSTKKLVRAYSSIKYADGYYWGMISPVVYKIDPSTWLEVASYTMTSSMSYGFNVFNGCIYYVAPWNLLKYTIATGVTTTGDAGGQTPEMAILNGYTYNIHYTSASIVKGDANTCMTVKTITAPGGSVTDIHLVNGVIYVAKSGGVYVFDPVGETFTLTTALKGYSILSAYAVVTGKIQYQNTTATNLALYGIDPFNTDIYEMMTRKLLTTPVVKTSANTMKIIYDFIYA